MVHQATLRWSTPGSPGGNSIIHAPDLASMGVLIGAWAQELLGVSGFFQADSLMTFNGEVREYNTATGALIDVFATSAVSQDYGSAPGSAVANASQVLFRWNTGTIVGGRRLRGRSFIPGLSSTALSSGEILGSALTALQAAAADIAATGDMVIWHRPVNGAGGSFGAVTGAAVWNELAVMRSRRN